MNYYTGQLFLSKEAVDVELRRREHETAKTGITENEFRIRKGLAEHAPLDIKGLSIKDTIEHAEFNNPHVRAHLDETQWTSGKVDYTVFLTIGCGGEELFTFDRYPDALQFFNLAKMGS
jgi:hypothetical protein